MHRNVLSFMRVLSLLQLMTRELMMMFNFKHRDCICVVFVTTWREQSSGFREINLCQGKRWRKWKLGKCGGRGATRFRKIVKNLRFRKPTNWLWQKFVEEICRFLATQSISKVKFEWFLMGWVVDLIPFVVILKRKTFKFVRLREIWIFTNVLKLSNIWKKFYHSQLTNWTHCGCIWNAFRTFSRIFGFFNGWILILMAETDAWRIFVQIRGFSAFLVLFDFDTEVFGRK